MRFRFNEKKAAQVATYLIYLSDNKLNYMKLVKLIYLADRQSLIEHGKPITGSNMVSLPRGPVPQNILDLIRHYNDTTMWSNYITPPTNNEVSLKLDELQLDELSKYEINLLKSLYDKFIDFSQFQISDWTHKNIPEWKDPGNSSIPITFIDILIYNNVSEENIKYMSEDAEMLWSLESLGSDEVR